MQRKDNTHLYKNQIVIKYGKATHKLELSNLETWCISRHYALKKLAQWANSQCNPFVGLTTYYKGVNRIIVTFAPISNELQTEKQTLLYLLYSFLPEISNLSLTEATAR